MSNLLLLFVVKLLLLLQGAGCMMRVAFIHTTHRERKTWRGQEQEQGQ